MATTSGLETPLIPSPNTTLTATTNNAIPFTALVQEYDIWNYNTTVGVYVEENMAATTGSPYLPPAVSANQPSFMSRRVTNLNALNLYPTAAGLVLNGSAGGGLVIRGFFS